MVLKIDKVLQRLGKIGKDRVKVFIDSTTLRESLDYRINPVGENNFELEFFVPHYWAIFYHDGRGPIFSDPGKKLVFFVDPDDDPRIQPARTYPVKESQVQKLSADEFNEGLEINAEMYEDNPGGGTQQYMIVTTAVGPAGANPFFSLGLKGFSKTVSAEIKKALTEEVKASIKQVRGKVTIKLL